MPIDDNVKHHIDLIETQILRMSENSKQMKTWCIALISGVVGVYMQTGNWAILWIGIAITILFAWMDAYYLLIERQFRCVYNDVIGVGNKKNEYVEKKEIPLYAMPRGDYKKGFWNHLSPIWSFSIFPIYLSTLVAIILLLCFDPGKKECDIQKIQLTDSSIDIKTTSPIIVDGKDSVWLDLADSANVNVNLRDSLLVKNFNKCVKYVSSPCLNKD